MQKSNEAQAYNLKLRKVLRKLGAIQKTENGTSTSEEEEIEINENEEPLTIEFLVSLEEQGRDI